MPAKKKNQTFEDHLGQLEEIVDDLESGELALDAALARYGEGVERLKHCYELLQKAEQQVTKLVGESEEEPFEEESSA
ncbi:MAG: exodeoxyribonuclease VII small subunit [Planctomycetota bacterium]